MLKIKSKTDVITNSSSEAFLIRTYGKTPKEIIEELKPLLDLDGSGGMGGYLGVYNGSGSVGEYGENWRNLPPHLAVVDVDREKKSLIRYLFNHYFVLSAEEDPIITDPITGRGIEIGPREKEDEMTLLEILGMEIYYENLQKEQKDHKAYLRKIQNAYRRNERFYKKYGGQWNETKKEFPTPASFVKSAEKEVSDWFEKHPTSILGQLDYDYDKDKIN